MRRDYHMHPQVILGAERFDAYAEKALEQGVEEVCISDHMPLSVSAAKDRIPAGRVGEYCEICEEIRQKYEGRLRVKCGIEIDYHPAFMNEIEAVLSAGKFDWIHGSTHLHASCPDMFSEPMDYGTFASKVLENTLAAVRSGLFDALPHIDQYRWVFAHPERYPLTPGGYRPEDHLDLVAQILEEIKARGMRLEINPHFATKSNDVEITYPCAPFTRLALDMGVKFSYGSDSHVSKDVGVMLPELRAHPLYGPALATWEEA